MNDIIEYLLNLAYSKGFSYTLISAEPHDLSMSFKAHKCMVINMNWYRTAEIPFKIAHELGHLTIGEQGIMYYQSFSGQVSEEKQADLYALTTLYNYSTSRGDSFTDAQKFMEAYGIPQRMEQETVKLFRRDLIMD